MDGSYSETAQEERKSTEPRIKPQQKRGGPHKSGHLRKKFGKKRPKKGKKVNLQKEKRNKFQGNEVGGTELRYSHSNIKRIRNKQAKEKKN